MSFKRIRFAVFFIYLSRASAFLTKSFQRHDASFSKHFSANWDEDLRELKELQERQTRDALLDALVFDEETCSQSLIALYVAGQARIPVISNRTKTSANNKRIAMVLNTEDTTFTEHDAVVSSLLVPLNSEAQLKLVSFAAAKRPLSQSVLLNLNTLLVNRDGALFDNIPWSSWSIDPQKRNRDAAGNEIESRFHFGKRDAYNRFLGKDWQGRSLAIGNMALRLRYILERDANESKEKDSEDIDADDEESQNTLVSRMLQIRIRELQMDLAELESELAIERTNGGDMESIEQRKRELQNTLTSAQNDLGRLSREDNSNDSAVSNIMDRVAKWSTNNGENAAPYRGATGYAPVLDSKQDIEGSLLPYTSPYDLLKEILDDQLNAKVIGCLLENTSLLRGNIAIGGAIVIQRKTPQKIAYMDGEKVGYNDYDEDFGNRGIRAGEIAIVECDSDEAIAVALACDVPLKCESDILERASVLMECKKNEIKADNIMETLRLWSAIDPEMNFGIEGEALLSQNSNPISIPRTTTSLFDGINEEKPKSSSLFPTDNPIKSVEDYDGLSNEDKALTLLEMSNFEGKLPRPRVVRKSEVNPLDQLLMPIIDESVRRQLSIREAEARGDLEEAEVLGMEMSQRQAAKEKAEEALNVGNDKGFEQWQSEAEFLESLRADVTQDEGAYSRFLDRDDWYERERQATAKRVNKAKFGNLLDGIE